MAWSLLARTLGMRSLLLLGLASGCALLSDGEDGDRGLVRFSLVHDYVNGRDFTAPIAVGRTVLIALQRPDGETFTELELRVEDPRGKELEAIAPLGFAQYAAVLAESGPHRLIAIDREGRVIDSLAVRAEEIDDLEVDRAVRVTTFRDDQTGKCNAFEELALENVVLHPNQTLELFVVPRSRSGEAMLGLLALTARGPASVELQAPLVGEGRVANALIIQPVAEMSDVVEISIEDTQASRRLETPIAATNEQKLLSCSG